LLGGLLPPADLGRAAGENNKQCAIRAVPIVAGTGPCGRARRDYCHYSAKALQYRRL